MAWFSNFVRWLFDVWVTVWDLISTWSSSLARPFKSSPALELPTTSPFVPSTPSFIQDFEPNLAVDPMKIFQLSSGYPRVSRIARTKVGRRSVGMDLGQFVEKYMPSPTPLAYIPAREELAAYHDTGRHASIPSDKFSPGFSIFSDVTHTLAPSMSADSPSLYSSPATSPTSTLNALSTPGSDVLYIGPKEESLQDSDEVATELQEKGEDLGSRMLRPGQTCVAEGVPSFPLSFRPDVGELAKRRAFMGCPIITRLPHELLFLPPPRGGTATNDRNPHPPASPLPATPRSTLSTLTDIVCSPTPFKSPKAVKRHPAPTISILEPTYDQPEPFGALGESYFAEDDLAIPSSTVDINDIDVYRHSNFSTESALSASSPKPTPKLRRKARHVDLGALASPFGVYCHRTNVYYGAIYSLSLDSKSALEPRDSIVDSPKLLDGCDVLVGEGRVPSVVSSLGHIEQESDESCKEIACSSLLLSPSPLVFPNIVEENSCRTAVPTPAPSSSPEAEAENVRPTTSTAAEEAEELKWISKRLSDYASMVFPFSLDDPPATAGGSDYDSEDSDEECDKTLQERPSSPTLGEIVADRRLSSIGPPNGSSEVPADASSVPVSPDNVDPYGVTTTDCRPEAPLPADRPSHPVTEELYQLQGPSQVQNAQDVPLVDNRALSSARLVSVQSTMSPLGNVVLPETRSIPSASDDIPGLDISTISLSTKSATRKRNRGATIIQSIPISTSGLGIGTSLSEPSNTSLVGFLDPVVCPQPMPWPNETSHEAPHIATQVVNSPAHSSILGLSAGVSCPPVHSPAPDRFSTLSNHESVSPEAECKSSDSLPSRNCNGAEDNQGDKKNRARRAGIYGGLPRQHASAPLAAPPMTLPRCLGSVAARSRSVAAERHRSSIIYSSQRLSKRGSSLRPLVLPLRIALRENGAPTGGETASIPNTDLMVRSESCSLKQPTRTSIGRPPAFPLPALPIRAALRRKAAPQQLMPVLGRKERTKDRLNALIALIDAMDVASLPETDSECGPSTPTTPSTPADLSVPEPTSCGPPPKHGVNWGIAF